MISRRTFLKSASAASLALMTAGRADATLPAATAAKLPRWHGFNLLEKFMMPRNDPFVENDFAWIAELGCNFVRLPMDYRCWIDGGDWTKIREETLKESDVAVAFGEKHGVHVCLNFHRAPGYTVAQPAEAKNVWIDEEARNVCAMHWERFAERYKGVPNERISFNLFNEPGMLSPDLYRKTVERMLEAIRKHDPERLVICDGRLWGCAAPAELVGLGVTAATRGYNPMKLTHYKASWVGGADAYPLPSYPLQDGSILWDKEQLRRQDIEPWKALEAQGMGVMVGEFGAFNQTPHKVVLDWLRDLMSLWKEAGWGWAMWNFRGSFGILDSDRADAAYEPWHDRKLDKAMWEVLKAGL